MEKGGSSFNDGQRPLMLNVTDNEVSGWRRVGESIFYFRNNYKRPPRSRLDEEPASEEKSLASKKKKKAPPKKSKGATDSKSSTKVVQYFTVSLEIEMPKEGKCFLCNCYPFNYTTLRQHVSALEKSAATNFVKSPLTIQSLCTSPGGVPVPLLTITSYYNTMKKVPYTVEEIRQRPVVLLDARVHPGESNSSWVMKGLLDFLLCPNEKFKASVESLLSSVVIKAIPMINVDGVIMGNHRCSFYGVDLNRDYLHPDPIRNPVIYSMKQLLRQVIEVEQRPVVLYADFHGHSRAKNFLVYGCTPETIVGAPKEKTPTEAVAPIANEKIFPAMLGELCPMFSLKQSNYAVGKDKKGSARVVMYKEFNIRMSYGFEGTMMGGVAPDFDCNDSWENTSKRRSIACGNIETHYNQINYQRFGESFVATLCALVEYKNTLLTEDVDESEKCLSSPMKRAWNTAKMSGRGKLGLADTQSSTSDERVAGSYVLASRQDRREEEVADCDVKDVVQAMAYLFPKDVTPIKETEDAEDDDGDDNDDEDVDDYLTLLQKQDTEDTGAEVPQSDLIEDVAEKEDNVSEGTASSSEDDDEGDANDEENRAKSIQDFEEEDAVVNTLPSNVLIL
ncbi:zinc carboxypeptidase [Angomonas deanei]|uniref:Zinc carboxypeptidase, putative n=1 Tax=Angomonas deanei TaxID=59799 RepID=A0A7G2CEB6_9TRYP|nr:zinc carboxypeptidase [Angomonas deanei]CAD2217849.1 Zinc carboxypeptidase, putative [Angomonas deanei]|eukprot:EPY18699.1 zinc carboxypeptidase [Angomonas deanei]